MLTVDLAELLAALADLAWPLLAATVLVCLWPVLRNIAESRSFTIDVGGMKISVQKATDELLRNLEDLQQKVQELRAQARPEQGQVKTSEGLTKPILAWVDDVPENNAYEIARLRRDGVEVLEMESTDDAVHALVDEGRVVNAVVSDMGRREQGVYNRKAGLDLIRALRNENIEVPIYVYTSPESVERIRDKVGNVGGSGATASQLELFELLDRELYR